MTTYTMQWANGRPSQTIEAKNKAEAESAALSLAGSGAVAYDWDANRLLIWASEADSVNDDGQNAIAVVIAKR